MTYEELKAAKAQTLTVSIKSTGAVGQINGVGLKSTYLDFTDQFSGCRHLLLFPNAEFQLSPTTSPKNGATDA